MFLDEFFSTLERLSFIYDWIIQDNTIVAYIDNSFKLTPLTAVYLDRTGKFTNNIYLAADELGFDKSTAMNINRAPKGLWGREICDILKVVDEISV